MPASVTALDVKDDACKAIGGISHAYWGTYADITALTSGGVLTVGSSPARLDFDLEEDNAFINVTNSGEGNLNLYDFDGLMSYPKVTESKVAAAHNASLVCALYFIFVYNSGYKQLIGVDYDRENSTYGRSKKRARIKADVMSDTGDNIDRVDFRVVGQGKYLPLTVDMTDAEIALL